MAILSKDAFAVMAMCAKNNEHFGITVDPRKGVYTFCWGFICNRCGKIVCYDGEEYVTCPNCGGGGTVQVAESFDLSGGGF